MKKNRMTAVLAERIFGLAILLLLVGLVVDFIFVTNFLKTEAAKTEVLHQQSDVIDSDITKLKAADVWLRKNDDVVKRTSAIVAQSKLYQYQNQIINDFNSYGAQTGIAITGYSFTQTAATGAAPAPTPAGTPATVAKAPAGVNSVTVTINFASNVEYQRFLNLLRLLEQNVTRMQVTQIALSPDPTNPNLLVSPNISVIVYTR
jgi:hypothetical protein